MKKLGILFATVIMIMLFAISVSAKEVVDSGECGAEGDNVTWVLYDDGELLLNGSGKIKNYHYSTSPLYNNEFIKIASFSNGITNIGAYLLNQCENLESVVLPNTVESIGNGSFSFCRNLVKMNIPLSVKTIGDYAFNYCDKLVDLNFQEGIEIIGDSAFSYCENLKNVNFPNSVTSLGESAFSNCGLTSVFINHTLLSIGKKAFYCCYNITEFNVDNNNPNYSSDENGILYNKDKSDLIQYPTGNINKNVIIIDSVNNLWEYAFVNCDNIVYISMTDSIKTINRMTFWLSDSIKLIDFRGSQEQWNKIYLVSEGNDCILNAKIHTLDHKIENRIVEANCIEPKIIIKYCIECDEKISESIVDDKLGKHTTTNGKCDNCKAFIVEQGMSIELQCTTNSDGSWVDTTNIFNISKTGKSTVSVGGYYSCTHYVTIKALNVGEADLYLVASNNAILSQSKIIVIEHTHNYALSTKTPTCTEVGTKTYTCTCGDTYTETIPATNHANATTDSGKEPTTTEVGYTAGKYCPDCKVWIEGHEEIPKLEEHEHQFAQVDKKHSTCTETGIRYYECYCGAKREEEIPMMPHVFIYDSYEKWPTCTEEGIMKTECSCGEKSQETIPANGHSLAYNIEVEATCTKDGLTRGSYCPNCDLVYEPQKVIPAFGHNFKIELIKGTLTMGGMANRVCQNCRATKTIAYYPVVNSFKIYDAEYIYDGKVKKPVVVVNDETGESLVEGRDYTLSYEDGRKLPGKYAIKITLMGNYEGEKTIYFSIFPGKTSKLVASQTNDTITLKWRKVEGATGYRVYQYNSKTKKYVKLKNTTGTSYTVKKLKAGTTYKFAVKAYTRVDGEVIWADSYKTLKTATKPATPTVKVTAGTKKATLSWNKVTGATGYLIYMRNSDGSYEKVGTTKKTSYTVSDLSYGEKCYFRVRAYKTVDGKNIYGGFKTYSATVPYPAVYVTPSGKRYHYDKECAGKNATKTTFANAQKTKTPCKSCVI